MKLFGKWFSKDKDEENKDVPAENTSAEAENEVAQETSSKNDNLAPEDNLQEATEAEIDPQIEENFCEETVKAQDEEKSSQEQPLESKDTSGGLKGLWEKTKNIALTPVDPWFSKMADGLNKTRQNLVYQVSDLLKLHGKIDEEFWEELEAILLTADVGISASDYILDQLRGIVKERRLHEPQELLSALKEVIGKVISNDGQLTNKRTLDIQKGRVNLVLMVGVNGTGKTTTTAKLANYYKEQGYKVMLAAADTFRAAAIDQLQVWADRIGVDIIRHQEGSDPAAVVFDAVSAAKARNVDVLFVDTAGRLHNKANLMEELRKIRRVAAKDLAGAPHEVLLVLDATTGQNALEQAKIFHQVTELTGLVLCKLDGTGKGGIVAAIAKDMNIPVKFIGVGEGVNDLREFVPEQFLDALFAEPGAYEGQPKNKENDESAS